MKSFVTLSQEGLAIPQKHDRSNCIETVWPPQKRPRILLPMHRHFDPDDIAYEPHLSVDDQWMAENMPPESTNVVFDPSLASRFNVNLSNDQCSSYYYFWCDELTDAADTALRDERDRRRYLPLPSSPGVIDIVSDDAPSEPSGSPRAESDSDAETDGSD